MRVKDILKGKESSGVFTVRPDQTMREAIQTLADRKVGALIVLDEAQQVVGVLSERDVVRECAKQIDQLLTRRVSEVMSHDVIIALVDDDLDAVMETMTQQHIRHLPVMDGGRLIGVISIGDVVKAQAHHCEFAVRHLTDYITGKYPG
jgi:CBS domain-containing protein